jgi:hypothetical protein
MLTRIPDMDQDDATKSPLSPRHMKWKHQIMKVGDMNMSIRSIQAKMSLLLEESKRTLDNADDVAELGQMFMGRYEGIGKDIQDLMEAWEAGKSSLASTIDKNERRVSSIGMTSPSLFGSKIPEVREDGEEGDGGVAAAWEKLTGGEAPPATEDGLSPDSPMFSPTSTMETFEAIATARPRSLLTRQERIQRAQEDRAAKLAARERALQQGWVMGELKDVLKNRGLNSVVNTNSRSGRPESLAPRLPVMPTPPRKPTRVTSMPVL